MKRKIPGLFLIIFMCAITYGASITVTSPKSGDVWCINQQHEITWTTNGQMHENVRIRLLNHPGLDVALAIVNSTPTDNKSYFWTIPATVSPGFYRMRVRTTDAAVWHDGEVFEIKDCSSLKPDLVIRDITFQVSGSSYFYSTRPVVNAKLVNNGPGPAPEAGVKLVVRGPGGFLDKAIYPAYKTQPLGPNETFQVGFGTVQLPGPGNYTYKIIADYNNKIIETFEGNNATSKPYNLPPCNLPDLKVTFQIKNETTFGSPIKKYLYAVTENIGQSASGACKLLETINDSSNKSYPIPSLAPGQKSFIRLKRMPTFPLNPIPTKKKIYINADYQYQVNECYEDNNSETGYF